MKIRIRFDNRAALLGMLYSTYLTHISQQETTNSCSICAGHYSVTEQYMISVSFSHSLSLFMLGLFSFFPPLPRILLKYSAHVYKDVLHTFFFVAEFFRSRKKQSIGQNYIARHNKLSAD
jgi:hypothetical protein